MGSEEVLAAIAQIAKYILPVVGVIVLIYLALFLKKLIETLKEVDRTLIIVEEQVRKLDEPLATVQGISTSVDEVHQKTREVVIRASQKANDNIAKAKDWVASRKEKETDPDNRKMMNEVSDTVKETVLSVCDSVRSRIHDKGSED